jgi:hypothetical protein
MKITFWRQGGFCGIPLRREFDTDLMEDGQTLYQMVHDSNLFNLPSSSPPPSKGSADYFYYKLEVEEEGKKHVVEISELSLPEGLRTLLEWLEEKATQSPL